VAAAGAGDTSEKGALTAFGQWFTFLIEVISALGRSAGGLDHFVWEAPGRERCGAALIRRLWAACNSCEFDRVKTVPHRGPTQSGIVLMLGRGGTTFEDLEAPEAWWLDRGYTCIRANHCGIRRRRVREMDRIMQVLVDKNVAQKGLICHFFSENGWYFFAHIMERWDKSPPAGLPPLQEVLRGIAYDSCFTYAGGAADPYVCEMCRGAAGEPEKLVAMRAIQKKGMVRNVVLNSAICMARNVWGNDEEKLMSIIDINGPVYKGAIETYAWKGNLDDAIFDNPEDPWKKSVREPGHIPRICFYSKADVTLDYRDCERTAEAVQSMHGVTTEMVLYETAQNCRMHVQDPARYFGRLGEWLENLPPHGSA